MTEIRIFNEVTRQRDVLTVPGSLDEVVRQLRVALRDQNYEIFATTSTYARVVGGSIDLFLIGDDSEEARAEQNRILGSVVAGRVTT